MHLRGKTFLIWLIAFCFVAQMNVQAAEKEENNHMTFYEDGDVVGFIGDSITHAEYVPVNYIESLYHYYLSRFPERKVEFRNLGIAGYTTKDVLDIYDKDRAFQGINKAVIMLGMNDALQEVSIQDSIRHMEELILRLKADGLKGEDILVLSPTPYDQTCALNYDKNGFPYHKTDDILKEFTEQLAEKTKEWSVNYLDLHTPMVELSKEIQREDAKNTLTIGDCIHPNITGQMIMSYYILKAQGADVPISEIYLPGEGQAQTVSDEITDFYRGDHGICWTWKPKTLPVPVTDEFQQFLQAFAPGDTLYQEPLEVEGLLEDTIYTVAMGEAELGTFTGRELAEGINLAMLETNPLQAIVQQAEVRNREWHQESAKYRNLCYSATAEDIDYTIDQLQNDFEEWEAMDAELRNEMYGIVQDAVKDTFRMTITEEGYSVEELEKEAEEARRRAEEARREAAEREEREKLEREEAQRKAFRQKLFVLILGSLTAVTALVSLFYIRKRKNK
ncbi:MAG: SGNH/GDSL hydrolase family protein [Lachnospiraceae bacterium]|nr:SGNH/GDSL hydrolase family protein [Lachnospiraceae bacterium]